MKNKMQLSCFVSCQDTVKVLTLNIFDSSYSCELGYKFLAGNEIVK